MTGLPYYDHLPDLRDALSAGGEFAWSLRLLDAERSACTGGELISNVTPLLRQLLADGTAGRAGVTALVEMNLASLEHAWRQMNGQN